MLAGTKIPNFGYYNISDLCGALLHSSNESDDHCFICLDGGKLVCCDTCHRTVHYHCVGLARAPKEKDDFVCLHCLKDSRSSKSKQKEQKDKGAAKANNAKRAGKEEEDAAPCRSSRSKVDKDTSASSSSKTRGKDKEVSSLHFMSSLHFIQVPFSACVYAGGSVCGLRTRRK